MLGAGLGSTLEGHWGTFWGDSNAWYLGYGAGCKSIYVCPNSKNHTLRGVTFTVCKSSPNVPYLIF